MLTFEIFKLPYTRFNQTQIENINNDVLQSYDYFARNQSLETRDKYIVVSGNGHNDHGSSVYYLNVYHNGIKVIDDIPNISYPIRAGVEMIDLRSATRVQSGSDSISMSHRGMTDMPTVNSSPGSGRIGQSFNTVVGGIALETDSDEANDVPAVPRADTRPIASSTNAPVRTRDEHIAYVRAEYQRSRNGQ